MKMWRAGLSLNLKQEIVAGQSAYTQDVIVWSRCARAILPVSILEASNDGGRLPTALPSDP